MRTIAKPIEVIAWFTKDGTPEPVKFKVINKDNETESVIKINKIITRSEERLAGNRMLIYNCMGVVGEKEREFEIKFELGSCKWILYRI